MSKIAIFSYLFAFKPPTEGFPWDDLGKKIPWMSMDGQVKVPNGEEKLRKFQPAE